jgi:ATP adenylyltransferase/5',5'''-P-1,P-4-tetraphosphate phosphorylase II
LCAQHIHKLYVDAMDSVRIGDSESYNLVITASWLLVVPRVCDKDGEIPHNSLAYCGYFLVKSEADLDRLRSEGPLRSLASTARSNAC